MESEEENYKVDLSGDPLGPDHKELNINLLDSPVEEEAREDGILEFKSHFTNDESMKVPVNAP